jgi:hypothetical protein
MAQSFLDIDLSFINYENSHVLELEHDVTFIIFKALKATGNTNRFLALNLTDKVIYRLFYWKGNENGFSLHNVEYMISYVLGETGYNEASRLLGNRVTKIHKYLNNGFKFFATDS